jgi:hypothetical protein
MMGGAPVSRRDAVPVEFIYVPCMCPGKRDTSTGHGPCVDGDNGQKVNGTLLPAIRRVPPLASLTSVDRVEREGPVMAIGWRMRTAAVGLATAGVLATGAATGTASAETRVMNAVIINEIPCSLGLVSATPGDRKATWAQQPPATVTTWGAWSVNADPGLIGSVNGGVEYVTKQCQYPDLNGIPVRFNWTLSPIGFNSYSGSVGNRNLIAGLHKAHYGLSPVFILTPRIG